MIAEAREGDAMTVSALSAAKTLCEMRGWSLSNMALQKILYLAHMVRLGESDGTPLIDADFEAWDYGPVVPEVYRRAKPFGSGAIRNVFHWIDSVPKGSPDYAALKEASDGTLSMTAGQLVSMTHWNGGAWARHYTPGARGVIIPNTDILDEYLARTAGTQAA